MLLCKLEFLIKWTHLQRWREWEQQQRKHLKLLHGQQHGEGTAAAPQFALAHCNWAPAAHVLQGVCLLRKRLQCSCAQWAVRAHPEEAPIAEVWGKAWVYRKDSDQWGFLLPAISICLLQNPTFSSRHQKPSPGLQIFPGYGKSHPLREPQWWKVAGTVCPPYTNVPASRHSTSHHARAHPPKHVPTPISGLHPPVLKAAIIIYCSNKEETQSSI